MLISLLTTWLGLGLGSCQGLGLGLGLGLGFVLGLGLGLGLEHRRHAAEEARPARALAQRVDAHQVDEGRHDAAAARVHGLCRGREDEVDPWC